MSEKCASESELTDIPVNGFMEINIDDTGHNEDKRKEDQKSICTKLKDTITKIFTFFTVEPFLLCFILPNIILALAVERLNMAKACRSDLNYSEVICDMALAGDASDNMTIAALDGAQVLVADMTAWKQPLQSGIPAILILFVGAWSDKTGNRKALMLIPIIGELVSCIGLLFTTYYFLEWPLWITGLIEALPTALSGGLSIALMGSYSYIADVTTVESRTFRVGVVAVIVTLGIPFGSSISGVLTEAVGYYGVFGIGVLLYLFGFIHTLFRIHDVNRVKQEGTWIHKLVEFFQPKNVYDTLSLLFSARGRTLAQIILVILAHIVITGPVFGEAAVMFLYTLKKYNMSIIEFSLFQTYATLMGLAGTAVAVTLFSKILKMHDSLIGMMATACKVMSSFVYALAPTKHVFYAGPVFDFFGNSGTTAIRSLGTKVVDPDKVGKMCSLIGFVEAVVPVIYTPLYSRVYSETLTTFSGAFYMLGGMMTVPAFFILLILYLSHKKQMRDQVKNPDAKEMYAHENAVSVL